MITTLPKQIFHQQRGTISPLCLLLIFLLTACGKETVEVRSLSLLSVSVNGLNLTDGAVNVPVQATFELTFSSALDIGKFESAFSLTSPSGKVQTQFSYSNATSKAIVSADQLAFSTQYRLTVPAISIGQRGETLDKPVSVSFTTVEEGEITEMAPCVSATDDCLQTLPISSGATTASFDFYSSFPIFLENARWKNLKQAVLVVHGQNRDAGDYFSFLTNTLRQENLQNNTILIAPFFKDNTDAGPGDLYWTTSSWREGQPANTPNAPVSSFEVIDRLVDRLADKDHFPVLKTIIITGHSTGALFAQVYAAANRSEDRYSGIRFEYVVANSQYFYYPDDVRYDEGTGRFVAPVNCPAFNHWPLGFFNPPVYLQGISEETVDRQITGRKVTYLLGNGSGPDSALNTTGCEAVLLGSSRFNRGTNIFLLLETNYASTHKSRKVVVNGVGHDGQGIYQSPEFRKLLKTLID